MCFRQREPDCKEVEQLQHNADENDSHKSDNKSPGRAVDGKIHNTPTKRTSYGPNDYEHNC